MLPEETAAVPEPAAGTVAEVLETTLGDDETSHGDTAVVPTSPRTDGTHVDPEAVADTEATVGAPREAAQLRSQQRGAPTHTGVDAETTAIRTPESQLEDSSTTDDHMSTDAGADGDDEHHTTDDDGTVVSLVPDDGTPTERPLSLSLCLSMCCILTC